ncbi:phosphoglycerate mutase-like protein [Stipitochalara longipes BDJ]|nr:phosphoglycerate mutase-like protein [Stipitochalara longipes BDJ]
MAVFRSISLVSATVLLAQLNSVQATTFLSPEQDIVLPASGSASEPLEWVGANSPYFAGPNIYGISNTVPDNCVVEQVSYNVRHGSRYPDSGAYAQWTMLYAKIQNATFTATGDMAFLKDWQPVLTNSAVQMSQESSTGYKEAYDLGYQLRTRYPNLYAYGTPFISWANLYPRVVQTAQNFVRGFLGQTATALGTVISVNSTGSPQALFDSLSPSDQCPLFVDGNGGTEQVSWNDIYLPPILERIQTMITGDLGFDVTDVSIMPYLCGFESQITGTLSPWCGVFSDAELKQYEYSQDLRYYYGMGPGTDLPSNMMLPYLNTLVGLLAQGPGINGTYANGTSFTLPKIITAFMNDGQITELGAAIGIWDNTTVLSGTEIPNGYEYVSSHFVSMRGTVAFERLNCAVSPVVKARDSPVKTKGEKVKREAAKATITICPTQTGPFATYTKPAQSSSTSTITETQVYTITSCAPEITKCPVGKKTSTVVTLETVVPVQETTISTAWESWTRSTTLVTSFYTVTSCAPTIARCSVGELTSTIYETVTWCPITATETGVKATSTGAGAAGNRSSSGSATKTTDSVSGSGSSKSASGSYLSPTSTGSGISSGYISPTHSATSSPGRACTNKTSTSTSFLGTGCSSPMLSATGLYNTTSSIPSATSAPYTNATVTHTYSNSTSTSPFSTSTPTSRSTNQTFIRILINDAVYIVPSCQDGPGRSCLMSEYVALIESKLVAAGDLKTRCNVTNTASPTVLKGASFFTNLADSWLAEVAP